MAKPFYISKERGVPLLLFLWKWKFATTGTIYYRFFRELKKTAAYDNLRKMKKAGLLDIQTDNRGQKSVWTLSRKGFEAIRDLLPPLRQEGFRSENLRHDLLVTALHLGDWFSIDPTGITPVSEQQLRRLHPDFLPPILRNHSSHRPDGYTFLENGAATKVVAIEVELSRKINCEYEKVADFYKNTDFVSDVLWLVPSKAMAERIYGVFEKAAEGKDIHNFILLEEFTKNLWSTSVFLGSNKGCRVRDLFSVSSRHLSLEAKHNHDTIDAQSLHKGVANVLLDTRKKLFVSNF